MSTADKLQFERYKKVLGTKEVGRSLDAFQSIKYNEPEKWTDIKKIYAEINVLDKKVKNDIIGLETLNGITISGLSDHARERIVERKVTIEGIKNSLEKPLHVGNVKTDDMNRKSQRFIGEYATSNVNPETGVIATVWKTGSSTVKKYKKGSK